MKNLNNLVNYFFGVWTAFIFFVLHFSLAYLFTKSLPHISQNCKVALIGTGLLLIGSAIAFAVDRFFAVKARDKALRAIAKQPESKALFDKLDMFTRDEIENIIENK